MKRYCEFTVWNKRREHSATREEVIEAILFTVDKNGKVEVEIEEPYTLMVE